MSLLPFLSTTLDAAGTVLIAYTALRVHDRVQKERVVDARVSAEMKREQRLGVIGIALIVCGFVLALISMF